MPAATSLIEPGKGRGETPLHCSDSDSTDRAGNHNRWRSLGLMSRVVVQEPEAVDGILLSLLSPVNPRVRISSVAWSDHTIPRPAKLRQTTSPSSLWHDSVFASISRKEMCEWGWAGSVVRRKPPVTLRLRRHPRDETAPACARAYTGISTLYRVPQRCSMHESSDRRY